MTSNVHAASSSVYPHSDVSLPPLVPLLERILGASAPAFSETLADSVHNDESSLRQALFPVTREHVYLNHASVGPFPAPVAWATRHAIDSLGQRGSLEMEQRTPEAEARDRFARLINVPPETIAFTKNVSDSFMTLTQGLDWRQGDNVVTITGEFPANVYPWLNLAEHGVETRFAPLRAGWLDLDDLAALIDDRTRVVTVSFVQFSSGLRADVAAIARLAHARGALCVVDGIQGLGALRLDATAAEVDVVCSGSAKWLLSPAHLGLLYVRPSVAARVRAARRGWLSVSEPFDFFNYEQPQRADAGRLEGGSNNWLGLVALSAALELLQANDAAQIEARALGLAALVRVRLTERGYDLTSPDGLDERSPIITFRWPHSGGADEVVARLAGAYHVVLSARNGLLRISPHFYNTTDDVERLFECLDAAR